MNTRMPTRHTFDVTASSSAALPTAVWEYPAVRGDLLGASARPVLLVHGFRGDHHGMNLIARDLRSRQVFVPDLPGFGETPPLAEGLTLQAYTAWLDALVHEIARRTGRSPLVVGHSFGSILVAHWAAGSDGASDLSPTRTTDVLAFINPITSPALEGPSRFMTALARFYYAVSAELPERAGLAVLGHPLIVRIMSEVMATTRDRGLRRYIHDQHARYFSTFSDRDSLAEAFDVSVSHTVREVEQSLMMPVHVIAGTADAVAPEPGTRAFVAALPRASVEWFSGVGHLVHYERPLRTAQSLEEFWTREGV